MKLFFKMKPLLRSAQAEEELAALRAELRGLRGALATAEAKRQELEETHVSVTQEKNDLALQLQAVRRGRAGFLSATWCPDPRASSGNPRLLRGNSTGRRTVPHSPRPPPPPRPAKANLACAGCSGFTWVLFAILEAHGLIPVCGLLIPNLPTQSVHMPQCSHTLGPHGFLLKPPWSPISPALSSAPSLRQCQALFSG